MSHRFLSIGIGKGKGRQLVENRLVRIAAFVLRAFLTDIAKDGPNLDLLVVFGVTYNVGFLGLLYSYSAYTLVLDRGLSSDAPLPDGPISRITRRRPLFRIALAAAVAVRITGAIEAATGSTQNTINVNNTLRKFSTYIFLVLCIIVGF
ncbi:hypothetical protein PAXINDRAFT_13003 [Paxillus involutus ATCC 200175]|uniref:Uncharacterized protein n=1 Tax=Paxillus involutus ATCC 200175 TaxID=664439 RepID=A0A0C9U4D2_PAXIN|nr:hypothetical protein PAXINDRAFT_13003 [Paxillus involutus ATCC 200175]